MRRSLLIAFLLSCSGQTSKPDCHALGERCHKAGTSAGATAMQRECHDKAHEGWSNAECVAKKAACEAVCPLDGDGGHHHHGHDGG